MGFLTAVVVLVGLVAVLNLVLTLGVVRRLRDHTERFEQMSGGFTPDDGILLPGQRPEEFTATTVDGREVSHETVAGPALVGFFMPGCGPCHEWVPRFAAAAADPESPPTMAVVVGGPEESTEMVATLSEVTHVIVEDTHGPVAKAFAVQAFPVMCRTGDDGTVLTASNDEVVGGRVGAGQR
ncbi:redoxin domain-containing protein [Spiractinospora alimapuensis]|uniref:TlpA family protein disulfide reductase n=1 Tax=Spiractinospora alimapuensis TaxID=2820884 RepID=UPI001F4525FC|nr:redoxin domain-containing protein [Spiractinospora alimapuensis]QVQ52446.1 redoxin domain-containing protein [Spiractinospora alimapuensis]